MIIRIHDEFHRSSSDVSDSFRSFPGLLSELLSKFESESRSRRFFDDLLVTTLDGAISFEERDVMTLRIREDLDFDIYSKKCCQRSIRRGELDTIGNISSGRVWEWKTYDEE